MTEIKTEDERVERGTIHAKLCATGRALARMGEGDFAGAAAGDDGEDMLNIMTGLCFNAADEIKRLQDAVRILVPACGLGCTASPCPYPTEPPSAADLPCCIGSRSLLTRIKSERDGI